MIFTSHLHKKTTLFIFKLSKKPRDVRIIEELANKDKIYVIK